MSRWSSDVERCEKVVFEVLADVPTDSALQFKLAVPQSCLAVAPEILNPQSTLADPVAYDEKTGELPSRFERNYQEVTSDDA